MKPLPRDVAQASKSPFLRIYFAIQSNLQNSTAPCHVKRQRRVLGLYAGFVTGLTITSFVTPSAFMPALLGAMFPGAGFLHWAAGDQFVIAIGLSLTGLGLFTTALVLWFATGNLIAPLLIWAVLAAVSGIPSLFTLSSAEVASGWPSLLAPFAVIGLGLAVLRPIKPPRAHSVAALLEPKNSDTAELPLEELQRLRLLLDRALQPADRFDGFEWRDQFQSAAVRYQVNFVAYALALARRRYAPAADAYYREAQMKLLTKIGDRRMWSYWRLENAWGNFRLNADPIPHQNIMYPGFTTLQMAIGGNGGDLVLHDKGHEWRRYDLETITRILARQYGTAPYGLLTCEPNWIYPLCNLITVTGLKAADAAMGAGHWPRLEEDFLRNLQREGTKADGSFIAFRSALTGIAPPTPGGIVMQSFPCLFLNCLAPDLAQAHWQRIRAKLDSGDWRRLFWPADIGNYGLSRATSYTATAAAAAEIGDMEIAAECLQRLEMECPSHLNDGVIHRERASLWAHALEIAARATRKNGWRDLVVRPRTDGGPRLARASYPDVLIARAESEGHKLHLVLYPGRSDGAQMIGLSGLMPEQRYLTGHESEPVLTVDHAGHATLRVVLRSRTALTIEPVI
jgi:hypothetical protein